MSSHSILQGIFPIQGSNLGLLHCRKILYHLSHQGSRITSQKVLPDPEMEPRSSALQEYSLQTEPRGKPLKPFTNSLKPFTNISWSWESRSTLAGSGSGSCTERNKVKVWVAQSCPTLWDLMDCSQSGSSVHGIPQARILEWVPIPFSRGIFPTQGLNPGLLHCRRILYHLSHQVYRLSWGGHLLLAAGLRSSLAGPSTGILITWQLALPWVSDPRGSKKTTRPEAAVSHNLTSEAASHPLFCVMFVPQTKLGATCEWTTQEYRREPGSHNRTNTYKPYVNTYFYLTRWVYF